VAVVKLASNRTINSRRSLILNIPIAERL